MVNQNFNIWIAKDNFERKKKDMEAEMVDSFTKPTRNYQHSFVYNWQSLQSNLQVLNGIASKYEEQVKETEKRKRKREVENWYEGVGKIRNEFLKLQKDYLLAEVPQKCISEIGDHLCVINEGLIGLIEQSQNLSQFSVDVQKTVLDNDQSFSTNNLVDQDFQQDLQRMWACLSVDC
ncbi:uncharacterized protein [Nicotiana tomentosiformis]|uniref:uncharacterized protein n=1 Tax=Nicotiana tomentosiformis TaxID=4098 RepID=UPI00051BE8F8